MLLATSNFFLLTVAILFTMATAFTCPTSTRSTASFAAQDYALRTFAHRLYNELDLRGAFNDYVAQDMVEHSPFSLDGRDNAVAALSALWSIPGFKADVKELVVAKGLQGETKMWTYVRGVVPGSNDTVVVDCWRVVGTCIVEHWDVVNKVGSEAYKNPHAYF